MSSCTGSLPILRTNSTAAAIVSSEVSGPRITSTQRMTSAGLKKWTLQKRSRARSPVAIAEGTKLEEFEARIVPAGDRRSSVANSSRLTSSFSIAASMTRSTPHEASSRTSVVRSRENAASISAEEAVPLSILRCIRPRSEDTARSSASRDTSLSTTSYPDRAQTMAIWEPIAPAPTTRTEVMLR